jgi:Tfp pilus assembly protein PilF
MNTGVRFSKFQRRLLVMCMVPLCACTQSPQVRSAKYVAAGKQLLRQHDARRAILQFRNAMKATPADAEVYFQLGEAFSALKDIMAAVGAYRKALELNPGHVQARLRMAQVLTTSNDPGVVERARNDLQELGKNATAAPEVLNTLAYAELRLGHIDSAIDSLDRILAQASGDVSTYAMLAAAKLLNHDAKGAEEALLTACKQAKDPADARRILGDFYAEQKRSAEAETQYRAALSVDPKNPTTLLNLARLQIEQGRTQEADGILRRLSKLDDYHSIHAIFLFEHGQRDQAIGELEKLAKDTPDDRTLRSNLAVAYRAAGRSSDASKLLAQALKRNPKDTDALLQRAEIGIGAKDFTQAEADLNQVLSLRPDAAEVHYLLAKLHQAKGEMLTYRQDLSEALKTNPNLLMVRVELAQSLSSNALGARAAIDILNAAPTFQKKAIPLIVQRNWAFFAMKDLAEMRKGIDEGLALQRTPDLLVQDGVWRLNSGDPAGARKVMEEALKINPSDLRALQILNDSYASQKAGSMGLERVKEYAASHPKSAPIQDFLGLMLLAQKDLTHARIAFAAAKMADPMFVKSDLSLVQADALEGKFVDARKRLQEVLKTDPNNNTARLWLGNIEEINGHHDVAIEQFRKVVDASPENAQASNNLAFMLSEYGNRPDEAIKYAERAVMIEPQTPEYCDTMGWILYRKGLYGQAVGYLEKAGANSGDVVWKYHLAMAYAKAGDTTRGRSTLEMALKINPKVPEAKLAQDLLEVSK